MQLSQVTRIAVERALADIGAQLATAPLPTGDVDACCDRVLAAIYLREHLGEVADELGHDALAAAVASAAGMPALGLFCSATRVGWTLAHVAGDDDDALAECARIDAELAAKLDGKWDGRYELVAGLVGIGVYALERGEVAHALAARVLDHLEAAARPRDGGLAWHTETSQLPAYQRDAAPDGAWDLGLAHGVPGVIAWCARCIEHEVEPARARVLLDGAMRYLLAQRAPGTGGWFPSMLHGDERATRPANRRLAWCYGDLGVACALVAASVVDERWQPSALELARDCATRSFADARVGDACVCHGAAGIAHVLDRIAQAAEDVVLVDAAASWLEHALVLPRGDVSLLEGATGVGLVLQAAISDEQPAWDRLLLVG